jgi:hypothetical protein
VIGAEAVRSMVPGASWGHAPQLGSGRPPRLGLRRIGQEAGRGERILCRYAGREEQIDVCTYEKSLDNWSAALVSREGSAPRAGHDRKPCKGK